MPKKATYAHLVSQLLYMTRDELHSTKYTAKQNTAYKLLTPAQKEEIMRQARILVRQRYLKPSNIGYGYFLLPKCKCFHPM